MPFITVTTVKGAKNVINTDFIQGIYESGDKKKGAFFLSMPSPTSEMYITYEEKLRIQKVLTGQIPASEVT